MKLFKFLFGWCYDFDAPDNKDNEMSDEEIDYVDKHFNDKPLKLRR
jgi:hypothetical protein